MAGVESNPGPRRARIVSRKNKYHKDESILSSTSSTHRETHKKSPYTDFKLLQFNCNGLRSKHSEVTNYMDLNSFHVAALQETKLNEKSKISIDLREIIHATNSLYPKMPLGKYVRLAAALSRR